MRRLIYSDEARDNFADISEYIATQTGSRKLAETFVRQLKGRCQKLAQLPGTLGRSRDELEPGVRSIAHKTYVILFRYCNEDVLEILTVVSGFRDIDAIFADD